MRFLLIILFVVISSCTSLNKKYPNFGADIKQDKLVVREIMESKAGTFTHCAEDERDEKKLGVVRLFFTINPEGVPTNIVAKTKNKKLSNCVENTIAKQFVFPRNVTGGVITVKQPLNFYQGKI